MTAYAIGHLRDVNVNDEITEYLARIDASLEPYGGRFLIHGAQRIEVLEGNWRGDLIVIAFPDFESAQGWYRSPAYTQIIPLRTNNSEGEVLLIEGVDTDHKATDILASSRS
jgi:uncharacterized protein (DUF1330 family)